MIHLSVISPIARGQSTARIVLFALVGDPLRYFLFLVFLAPDFSPTGKLVYAVITYLFLILMYASTVVPYVALLTTLTADPMDRLSANSRRFPTG